MFLLAIGDFSVYYLRLRYKRDNMSEIFEMGINWRLINTYVKRHAILPRHKRYVNPLESKNNMMMMSLKQIKDDFFSVRDWLYESDNVNGSFSMHGIFERRMLGYRKPKSSFSYYFIGAAFSFEKPINAAHFRLMWNSQKL